MALEFHFYCGEHNYKMWRWCLCFWTVETIENPMGRWSIQCDVTEVIIINLWAQQYYFFGKYDGDERADKKKNANANGT